MSLFPFSSFQWYNLERSEAILPALFKQKSELFADLAQIIQIDLFYSLTCVLCSTQSLECNLSSQLAIVSFNELWGLLENPSMQMEVMEK